MYADPTKIRAHVIKLRLNDAESALIDALVGYTGEQKAALLRDMLLEQARLLLVGDSDFGGAAARMEVPQMSLFGS